MAKKKKKKSKTIIINRLKDTQYTLYTDGGCETNPGGKGGYGVVVIDDKSGETKMISGGFKCTTNNRMEIMAGIVAMEAIPVGASAVLYSDSQYFIYCFNGIWKRNKNIDLFERADRVAAGKQIEFRWVSGHSGDTFNELCDSLATEARKREHLSEDRSYVAEMEKKAAERRKEDASKRLSAFPPSGSMSIPIEIPDDFTAGAPSVDSVKFAEQHKINVTCADAIIRICESGTERRFRDYMALKTGGMDYWSRKKLADLIAESEDGEKAVENVRKYFSDDKDVTSVMRWHCRGLPLKDSIRKVYVDKEVTAKANNAASG